MFIAQFLWEPIKLKSLGSFQRMAALCCVEGSSVLCGGHTKRMFFYDWLPHSGFETTTPVL